MHMSESSIKEIGELQLISLRLFSTFDQNGKNLEMERLRFQLKNTEGMNYRNVLGIKKLLE